MFSDFDANQTAKNLYNAVGYVNRRIAFTGRASDGAITTGLESGYIWVRPQAGGETRAKNVGAVSTRVPDVPVEIGENTRTGELEVIRVAPEAVYTLGGRLASRAAQGDVDPEYNTSVIPADLLQDLRVRAPDVGYEGLNVAIEAGRTEYGYRYKAHADVTAFLPPTAGMRWWVLAYLDGNNAVQFSTAGSTETGMPAAEMIKVPDALDALIAAIPDGSYPLYGFILENGQTAVTAANTLFKDARFHFSMKGTSTGSSAGGWTMTHDVTLPAGHDVSVVGSLSTDIYSLTVNGTLFIL